MPIISPLLESTKNWFDCDVLENLSDKYFTVD